MVYVVSIETTLTAGERQMLYFDVTRMKEDGTAIKARVLTEADMVVVRGTGQFKGVESRNDWRTFEAAKEVASLLGLRYVATDAGANVSPRYDIIELPQVGDEVSYAFNGDYYPCGTVKSISLSLRLIVTTEGQRFYRRGNSGSWKYNGTWSLVKGHVSKLNPEF